MHPSKTSLPGALLLALLAGCHPSAPLAGPHPSAGRTAPTRSGNGLVFDAAHFEGETGDLLTVLERGIAGMRVRYSTGCPEVILRARNSIHGSPDPGIYVDGAIAADTCVLDSIRVDDVERVEVYPMGVPSRPGYRANPNGLILVFMRTAEG